MPHRSSGGSGTARNNNTAGTNFGEPLAELARHCYGCGAVPTNEEVVPVNPVMWVLLVGVMAGR